MSTEIRTPIDLAAGTTPEGRPSLWRKQILPFRTINYKGRKISFDKKYAEDLIQAFRAGSHNQVPLQLADEANRHNNDPDRTRGHLVDLKLSGDGLHGVFELNPKGVEVVESNKGLGVSARILEGYVRERDGKAFPRAMQHVLATVDPRMDGQTPWQRVDLSSNAEQVTETIDLSMVDYTQEEKMTQPKGGLVTIELSQEDAELLTQVLEDQRAVAELNLSNPDGEESDSEEETPVPVPAPAPGQAPNEPADEDEEDGEESTELSSEHANNAIELATSTAQAAQSQVVELTNQLRQAQVEREVESLRNLGLAPSVIELARPALEMAPQAIELSNGESVDPGQIVRELLSHVIELANHNNLVIDLGSEYGVLTGTDAVQAERTSALVAWDAEYGN